MVDVKYDQHFLEDDEIVKLAIKEASISSEDVIFEIGPGKGVLSKAILEAKPKKLISVELDEMMKNEIQIIGRFPDFQLIFANALEEISNHDFNKLIANIPYAITEPLYKQILERRIPFVIILQGKTFYDTMVGRNSKWNFYVNAFYDLSLVAEVSGKSFNPPTKTSSALVKLELKKDVKEKELFIQNLFFKRKSKVKNAVMDSLCMTFGLSKKEARLKFEELKFNVSLWDEVLDTLPNEDFYKLVSRVYDKFINT